MKLTVGEIRQVVQETKIGMAPEYAKKEKVRETLQAVVAGLISRGEIRNEQELAEFFSSADMSLKALQMIPFPVWTRLAGSATKR